MCVDLGASLEAMCVPPLVIQEKEGRLRGVFSEKLGYSLQNLCEFLHTTPRPLCIHKAVEIHTAPGSVGLLILTIRTSPFCKTDIRCVRFLIIRRKHRCFCIVFLEKIFDPSIAGTKTSPHYSQKKRVFCIVPA